MSAALRDSLNYFKTQNVELVVITGDLVDVPLPFDPANTEQVLADYQLCKDLLDASGLAYHVIPGNHDELDCFFKIFEHKRSFEYAGYEWLSFYDHQDGGNDVIRTNEELNAFKQSCQQAGIRNQIHLQHYLITPEHNESWPHTYANANELLDIIAESSRPLLSLSGHYHYGSEHIHKNNCSFYVAKSFSEDYFHHAIITLNDEEVQIREGDIRNAALPSILDSPYAKKGSWYQGNLHMHCTESSPCSDTPLKESIGKYAEGNHDFLAITDHDVITSLEAVKESHPQLCMFEGFEHSVSNHMLFINDQVDDLFKIESKQEALLQAKDYLSIVCHPQGPKRDYWTVDELKQYPQLPTGVEVFNGHYGVSAWRQKGSGWDYTQFWSDCLDAGMRLFAYANDDYHDPIDIYNGWNVVYAPDAEAASLLDALKSGSCYASTGLLLNAIHAYAEKIVVSFPHKVHGRFVGPGNTTISNDFADTFEYEHQHEDYIRFEAEDNGKKLWTQAFFSAV